MHFFLLCNFFFFLGKPSPYYQQIRASRALSDAKEEVNSAAKKARKDCGPRFIDEWCAYTEVSHRKNLDSCDYYFYC